MSVRRQALCCCPACAATVRQHRWVAHVPVLRRPAPRRPAAGGRGRLRAGAGHAWVLLLLVAAAVVPMAAAASSGHQPPAGAPPVDLPTPIPPLPTPPPTQIGVEVSGPIIEWRASQALGSPNGGGLVDGVRLPASGTGYYTYDPRTQSPPGGLGTRWGTDLLVRQILDLGRWWAAAYPGRTPLGIGDMSREHGGSIDGHASHQNGLDVDIRLPRSDGAAGAADPSTYDRELTQALVDRLVHQGASLVLIGPSLDLYGPPGVVVRWPNHDDHLHVRWAGAGGGGD